MEQKHTIKERILVSGCQLQEHYDTQLLYFTCSSLSDDDKRLYLISNRDGHPNVFFKDLETGEERQLTSNRKGNLKGYVYFNGVLNEGLSKASVCLDTHRDLIYYIQDTHICKVDLDGNITVIGEVPDNRMTAFTHVSDDGKLLCVPMTDGRCLDFDPETEGSGLDKRPVYDIDGRVQEENLSSYLCVFDTENGGLLYEKRVPKCWITHVQFNPRNPNLIMYNHEWPASTAASAEYGSTIMRLTRLEECARKVLIRWEIPKDMQGKPQTGSAMRCGVMTGISSSTTEAMRTALPWWEDMI